MSSKVAAVVEGVMEINVRGLADVRGQIVKEDPIEQVIVDSDGSDDDEDENKEKTAKSKGKGRAGAKLKVSSAITSLIGTRSIAAHAKPVKRKVQDRDEGYDATDPFVDDSELALDSVKLCGIPLREGFFVGSGELELREETAYAICVLHLSLSKLILLHCQYWCDEASETQTYHRACRGYWRQRTSFWSAAKEARSAYTSRQIDPSCLICFKESCSSGDSGRSAASCVRTATSRQIWYASWPCFNPVTAFDESSPIIIRRESASSKLAPKSNVKEADQAQAPIHPSLLPVVEDFKKLIAKGQFALRSGFTESLISCVESFVPKNKFPEALKEPLKALAMKAVHCHDYEDNFFLFLTTILPYNTFTLTKLVKREVYPLRVAEIGEARVELTARLKAGVEAAMPALREAYDAAMIKYEEEHKAWEAKKGSAMAVDGADGASLDPSERESHQCRRI